MSIPNIVILGRPNVGKSTLFNRLVGHRKSIVSSEEGVTRDRIYSKIEWLGKFYNLIDTGGYIPNSKDKIEKQVKFQAEIAREEADLVLFVVDGRNDITSSDRHLAKISLESNKPCILVVNKIDKLTNEDLKYNFYELGITEIVSLSSQTGRNIGILLDKINSILSQIKSNNNDISAINYAIVGMPNVGKSSLMNYLLKEEKSIVTDIAGTTRDSIDSYIKYYNQIFRIIDTAGLRRKSKILDSLEFYSSLRTYKAIDDCDVASILIDASKGLDNQDKNIIRYIIDKGKGLLVVINKWDLVDEKQTNTMKEIADDMIYKYSNLQHYPIKFISIKNNFRVGEILKSILDIYKKSRSKISTSKLNSVIKKIVSNYKPPSVKGKEIKLNYAAHISVNPSLIAIFSNHPHLIPESYKRYVENQIRKEFDIYGVPIFISFRKK